MSKDTIYREDAIKAINLRARIPHDVASALYASMAINAICSVPSADRPQGEWIKMPHKEYLPWDCAGEYENPTYDEKDHSVVEWWWHCNKCFYEMSRDGKPSYNFCPNCGSDMRMKGEDDEGTTDNYDCANGDELGN